MNDNQKFLAGLILGTAAGIEAAMFLQSDKGKEFMSDVKDAASDVQDNLKQKLQSFDEEISALLLKGKQFVDDLENRANGDAAEEI